MKDFPPWHGHRPESPRSLFTASGLPQGTGATLGSLAYTVKLLPQPQEPVALGLRKVKPEPIIVCT